MALRTDWQDFRPPAPPSEEQQRAIEEWRNIEHVATAAAEQLAKLRQAPTAAALEEALLDARRFGAFVQQSAEDLLTILGSTVRRPEDGLWVPPAERNPKSPIPIGAFLLLSQNPIGPGDYTVRQVNIADLAERALMPQIEADELLVRVVLAP